VTRAPAILGLVLALGLLAPPAAATERHLLVIQGLGGEPEYAERFHQWSREMVESAVARLGLAAANVVWLAEDPERDPQRIAGPSEATRIEQAIAALAERSAPGDVVLVLLVGHGTARPGRALFNVPGPDLSSRALARALDELDGRTVVVVNSASASGAFLQALAAPGRVVVTATATGSENQHARFGGHFVEAYAGEDADADKDGRVSVLEAFEYARRAVQRDYERDRRILAEHAVIDDDGDGLGSRTAAEGVDGALAATVFLAPGALEHAAGDPQRSALESDARELVGLIEAHRRRKAALTLDDYEEGLEALLLELARNRRALAEVPSR
jgi:hypothetical protein